jgi:hypothetical protein
MEKTMIPLKNSAELVDVYDQAILLVSEGLKKIAEAKELLLNNFGEHNGYILERALYDHDLQKSRHESTVKLCAKVIQRNFWRFIVQKTEMRKLLSVQKTKELDDQISSGKLPDVSVENLFAFLEQTFSNSRKFVDESIMEVFNFLRPRNSYKTNDKITIGEKVILNVGDLRWSIASFWRDRFRAMEKLFYILDNRQPPKYPDDLDTKLGYAVQDGIETEFFKFKLFKKSGTIHIKFLRMDILQKINEHAGRNFLAVQEHLNSEK